MADNWKTQAKAAQYDRLKTDNALLRQALDQILVTCDGNSSPACDKSMALSFVRNVAANALHQPQSE